MMAPNNRAGRIVSGEGVSEAAEYLGSFPEVFLVYDVAVQVFARSLSGKFPFRAEYALETSEEAKSMDTVLGICRFLMDNGASRNALLLALGGGITTDISGFAAGIYKRGISCAFIPTTLLSQVDAAIGGKNGVNLDSYKNMVGLIRQPEFTYLCPEVLETLPEREFLGGAAELLKTFIIGDREAYREAVKLLSGGRRIPREVLGSLIQEAAAIKEGIVSRDLYENGERRFLNLGHTFAHAIEHRAMIKGTDISHGEAVAMGIVLAGRLSEALGLAPKGLASALRADFKAVGLPVESPFPVQDLGYAMQKDKKAGGNKVNFVVIRDLGDVTTVPLGVMEAIGKL